MYTKQTEHVTGRKHSFGSNYEYSDEHVDKGTFEYRLESLEVLHKRFLRRERHHSAKAEEMRESAQRIQQRIEVMRRIQVEREL